MEIHGVKITLGNVLFHAQAAVVFREMRRAP